MTIYNIDGFGNDDPKLDLFHQARIQPMKIICIKDNPPMIGFGRRLKKGDIITIDGTVGEGTSFQVACPEECAFYDYTYFDTIKEQEK